MTTPIGGYNANDLFISFEKMSEAVEQQLQVDEANRQIESKEHQQSIQSQVQDLTKKTNDLLNSPIMRFLKAIDDITLGFFTNVGHATIYILNCLCYMVGKILDCICTNNLTPTINEVSNRYFKPLLSDK